MALLALSDQHRLVRDRVVDALWPHLDPVAGAANLRKAAHHARQALGRDDAVRMSGGTVALFPSCEVVTDVESFEDRAEAAIRSGDRTACDAVDYPGDLLPDWLYEEWTQPRRDRVLALQVALLRLGGRWERLLEVEPADEEAHRALMRAALDRGDRHAAIRWYGRLRTNLEQELGLTPSPQSRLRCTRSASPVSAPPPPQSWDGRPSSPRRTRCSARTSGGPPHRSRCHPR